MPSFCRAANRQYFAVSASPVMVVVLLLLAAAGLHAQCPVLQPAFGEAPSSASKDSAKPLVLPEDGYLSETTYTNRLFGFALDLPITATGHLIKLPLMPERQHALLALVFQDGSRSGSMTITAVEPAEGLEGFSAAQQRNEVAEHMQAEAEPASVEQQQLQGPPIPQPLPPELAPPEYTLPKPRFHSSMHHKDGNYTAEYWTRINNYKVGVMIATNEQDFLRKAKAAMAGLRFYCPQEDGTLTTSDGKPVKPEGQPFEGPTVPTWRADAAIEANAAPPFSPGEVAGAVYRNQELGLQYKFPSGWEALPAHNGGDAPADAGALREFRFLHACSRTLLRLAPRAADGASNPDAGSRIVLCVLDPVCLAMPTPNSRNDSRTVEEVGASLEVLGEFGAITSQELVTVSNQLFMIFHGTIAAPGANQELAQRQSQTIFATRKGRTLFLWSVMSPTAAELAAVSAGAISFEGGPSLELRPAGKAVSQMGR
jgi:hypothetical protein